MTDSSVATKTWQILEQKLCWQAAEIATKNIRAIDLGRRNIGEAPQVLLGVGVYTAVHLTSTRCLQ